MRPARQRPQGPISETRKVWLDFRVSRRELIELGLWNTRLAIGVRRGETYRTVWREELAAAVRQIKSRAGQAPPPRAAMGTTAAMLLDRILSDISKGVSAAALLIALREPDGLRIPPPPLDFWQHELRRWIREDYAVRLEQVLRAYRSLRPGDLHV